MTLPTIPSPVLVICLLFVPSAWAFMVHGRHATKMRRHGQQRRVVESGRG